MPAFESYTWLCGYYSHTCNTVIIVTKSYRTTYIGYCLHRCIYIYIYAYLAPTRKEIMSGTYSDYLRNTQQLRCRIIRTISIIFSHLEVGLSQEYSATYRSDYSNYLRNTQQLTGRTIRTFS